MCISWGIINTQAGSWVLKRKWAARSWPNLRCRRLAAGFDEEELRQLLGQNFLPGFRVVG